MRSCRLLVNATSSNTQHKHEEYKFKLIKLSETLIYCHINPTNWKPQIIVPLFQPQISEIKHATTHIIIRRGDKKKRRKYQFEFAFSSENMKRGPTPIIGIKGRSQAPPGRALPEQNNRLFLQHLSFFLSFSAINATQKRRQRKAKRRRVTEVK